MNNQNVMDWVLAAGGALTGMSYLEAKMNKYKKSTVCWKCGSDDDSVYETELFSCYNCRLCITCKNLWFEYLTFDNLARELTRAYLVAGLDYEAFGHSPHRRYTSAVDAVNAYEKARAEAYALAKKWAPEPQEPAPPPEEPPVPSSAMGVP